MLFHPHQALLGQLTLMTLRLVSELLFSLLHAARDSQFITVPAMIGA
jgi:hypothetical protein